MKKVLLFICLLITLIAGCNNMDREIGISPYQNNKSFGLNEVNRRSGEFTDFVVTEQNRILMNTSNQNYYKGDIQKARDVISQIGLYEVGDIKINDNRLAVTAYSNDHLTPWTRREAEEDIRSHLLSTLPHYMVDVTVK